MLELPEKAAARAGLRYVGASETGIRRISLTRFERGSGSRVREKATLCRIKKLAIPPAWTNVWICRDDRGHLQATGYDAKGRKQYRYHPRFRARRDENKFENMLAFVKALPEIREKVACDLRRPKLSRSKVIATVVKLMELTCIRVGNEEYARDNGSFGLTTLRNKHAAVEGSTVRFHFKGKSGKVHEISLTHPRLARIVRKCQELPGQELFECVSEDGRVQAITSTHVNKYLGAFTAKDFRTWAGTVYAAHALRSAKSIPQAMKAVSAKLGNTPAVCRKSYVHPSVLEAFTRGETCPPPIAAAQNGLSAEEIVVLNFLQKLARRSAHADPSAARLGEKRRR